MALCFHPIQSVRVLECGCALRVLAVGQSLETMVDPGSNEQIHL